ncbi:hypothetical protein AN958_07475 [Leucoagaricus sp. SymC.cos]|nr:hypothetical protein AN958_07475 [Leucoagaricus sp. SymC.cos]
MHQQEEEYKKSVTIIFWYQANVLPVRLHHMIPTFPYFQLSKMGSLVMELGLASNTYLDTYNPDTGQWDQHMITAVRKVESQQRLLYRLRKSLLEGLKDEECLGIEDELKIQRRSNKSFRAQSSSPAPTRNRTDAHRCVCKRPSGDDSDVIPHVSHKVHIPNDYYINHQSIVHRNGNDEGSLSTDTGTSAATTTLSNPPVSTAANDTHTTSSQPLPTPPSSSSSNVSDDFAYPSPALYNNNPTSTTSTTNISSPPNLALPISTYPPHPPLKRWPNDYTVTEISAGFNNMDALVAQSTNGSTMTHKAAFERVFGSRYVKSTVCRHRGVWKKAHPTLKAQYEAMGHDERAYWGEFVRVVEGRPSSLRVPGSNSNMNPTPNSNLAPGQGVASEEEDGARVDESRVIKNLQGNQVGPTMQGLDGYDSPLASLTNTARS